MTAHRGIALAILLAASPAVAQPGPKPSGDVTSLMESGRKLFEAKDYLGALAVYKDAYVRFSSAKILLNIGTILTLLDRKAEAANAYQRYLDAPDHDPAKRAGVTEAIADLDKAVGRLEITVTPADAQVQINTDDAHPASQVKLYRVAPGEYKVFARKDKYNPETKSAQINPGDKVAVTIALAPIPESKGPTIVVPNDTGVRAGAGDNSRGRVGMLALARLDIPRKGGAGLVGVTVDIAGGLQAQGTAILGPYYGAYLGASYAILPGKLKPYLAVGAQIFESSGIRRGGRVAGGLEVQLNRHVALIAELGVDYLQNPEMDIKSTVFIPALGASGRL